MRKLSFHIWTISFLMTMLSCKKDDIRLYESDNYLQFSKHLADSSLFSFLTVPGRNEISYPIAVELIGVPEERERKFSLSVIAAQTTATAASYSLPASFILRAGRTTDTAWIILKKTPDIETKPVKLALKLEASDDFRPGQTEYTSTVIKISDAISKPDWWNTTLTSTFLGEYSDKKFALFIEVTGIMELDPSNIMLLREYTLLLKNYLLKEKDEGRTVYEANGSEMKVAFIGG